MQGGQRRWSRGAENLTTQEAESREIHGMGHECLNDEREVAVGCGEVGDDGGEAHWMLGLLEDDRSSFKEAKTETHDRAK